ncbi:helix-turn-helix domain-containing protein, partial [Klebsiella pneumoniae]
MFAERLKSLRKSKKYLTKQNMADILGVAKTTYASYEQG